MFARVRQGTLQTAGQGVRFGHVLRAFGDHSMFAELNAQSNETPPERATRTKPWQPSPPLGNNNQPADVEPGERTIKLKKCPKNGMCIRLSQPGSFLVHMLAGEGKVAAVQRHKFWCPSACGR